MASLIRGLPMHLPDLVQYALARAIPALTRATFISRELAQLLKFVTWWEIAHSAPPPGRPADLRSSLAPLSALVGTSPTVTVVFIDTMANVSGAIDQEAIQGKRRENQSI